MKDRRAKIIRRRLRFGPTVAKFFALVILTILGIIMMTQSTNSATKLYEKSAKVKERADLEQEVEEWKFLTNRQKTLKNLNNSEVTKQLEPIQNPDYIDSEVVGESIQR